MDERIATARELPTPRRRVTTPSPRAGTKARAPLELVPRARSARTNVTPALGSIVGRDDVLSRLGADVDDGHRLLTIVGPPGIGKTRVARAFLEARGAAYETQGGAFFCDLSEARTELDLVFALGALVAVRAPEAAQASDAVTRLEEIVAEAGPMLLVLDNFEQLTSCATLVRRLCARAKDLVAIVTSRERLAVEGEVVIELPPLALPTEGAADLDGPAARLFVARAREAGSTCFSAPPSARDARHVAAIVRKLEGLPLAIELFAARARPHSPRELEALLAHDRALVETGNRRDDGRHATLESAIFGSWDLLSAEERLLFARCSVFAGGFSNDLLAATFGEDATSTLASLRDKSLVYTTASGRVTIYASLRAFASERLAEMGPSHVADARDALTDALAKSAAAFVRSRNMPEKTGAATPRFADLRDERENLVVALAHASSLPPTPRSLDARADIACALALLLALPAEELEASLTAALEALGEGADPVRRASLYLARQGVRNSLGKYRECQSDLAAIRATSGLPVELRALARVYEGIQLRYQGRAREALPCHEEAARELEGRGFPRLGAMNDACMGRLMCDLADGPRARELNGRAFAASEASGDRWLGALSLANLSQLEQEEGAMDAARALLERAFDRLRDVGESHYEAIYAGVLGDLFLETGDLPAARAWYAHAARFLNRFATHRQTGILHAAAAVLEAKSGDLVAAGAHLERARTCAAQVKNPVVRLVVAIHETTVALAGQPTPVAIALARRRLADLEADGDDGRLLRASLDVRFATRVLRKHLGVVVPAPEAPAAALRVARKARAYVSPDGTAVSLVRRGSLFRIVEALVDHREKVGDSGLSVDALFVAGWPGERVLAAAAQTRVRVAVATLRKLGLRGVLVTRDDGYVLAPEVGVVSEDR